MRYVLVTGGLVLGLTLATRGGATVQPTTQPADSSGHLSVEQMLEMADAALALEGGQRGIDRYWLVALALHESSGYSRAVGDEGEAVGLHQFHRRAWTDCWGDADTFPRTDPVASFRAAIRYGKIAIRQYKGQKKLTALRRRETLSIHHHLGHWDPSDQRYSSGVERKYQQLVREYGPTPKKEQPCTKP